MTTTTQTTTLTVDQAQAVTDAIPGPLVDAVDVFAAAEKLGIEVDPWALAETKIAVRAEEYDLDATVVDEPFVVHSEGYRELAELCDLEAPADAVPYDAPGRSAAREYFAHISVIATQGEGLDLDEYWLDERFKTAFPEDLY